MRRRRANAALPATDAIGVQMSILALAAGPAVAAGAAPAGAKPYGRGEDLLLRFDPYLEDPLFLAAWVFWALAAFVGCRAILRLKRHFDDPKPGGLVTPVAGIALAIALATVPMLVEAFVEGLSPGYQPPVWRGGGSYGPAAEDLLHRLRREVGMLAALASWLFYMLAALAGGCSLVRFWVHVGNPRRGGLAVPVVGVLVAVALAAAPSLIEASLEGLVTGYRSPVWAAE